MSGDGERLATVEDTDVVQTQKPALKKIEAVRIFAVHPPCEVEQELVQDALEKIEVAVVTPACAVHFENSPGSPCVDWRIDIVKRPFAPRELAVGMHIPFPREQEDLLLGEIGIDQCERNAVERHIPRRVPRVFPLVWHGNNICIDKVGPLPIASPSAFARGLRMSRVALEPLSHVKVVKLFAPERPGERLALHTAHVLARDVSVDTVVELVRLTQPEREYVAEPSKRL